MLMKAKYLVRDSGNEIAHSLEAMLFRSSSSATLCKHDGLGYHQTFRRVTTEMAVSLTPVGAVVPVPRHIRVGILRSDDGLTSGFSREAVFVGANERPTSISEWSWLTVSSPTELHSEDRIWAEEEDGHGNIVSGDYSDVSSGYSEIDARKNFFVTMKKVGPRDYSYEGSNHQGHVSGHFKSMGASGLRTHMEQYAALKGLFAKGSVCEARFERYIPEVEMSHPIDVVTRVASRSRRKLTQTLEDKSRSEPELGEIPDVVRELVVDEQGLPLQEVIEGEGAVLMIVERKFIRGLP
jgi:hypothetical protein